MITDIEIATLCVGVYAYAGEPAIAWDYFQAGDGCDGVCFGIKRVGDVDAVIFRGSSNLQDWTRDLRAFAWPFWHDDLGPVHPGFYDGLDEAWAVIKKNSGTKRIIAGHSLGAGRASIMTGIAKLDSRPPIRRVVFGEPRPGFKPLSNLIASIPGASYRNGNGQAHDYITDVPFAVGFEGYMHPTPLLDVCAPPPANDHWSIYGWHHMQLYRDALELVPA